MNTERRGYRILVGALICSLCIFATAKPSAAADKEILTIPAKAVSVLPSWVALQRGYFSEQGLNIEIRRMRPNIAIKGMISGQIAYTTALGSAVRAAVSGVQVRAVMAYLTSALGIMMANPNLKSMADFKGEPKQIIGTEVVGGTMEYMQRQFLQHYGLVPGRDVTLRVVGFAGQREKALIGNVIAATIVGLPQNELLKAKGFNEVVYGPDVLPEFLLGGLAATVKKIKEDRENVKKAIRACLKASHFIRTEADGTIDILARWYKMDRRFVERSYPRLQNAYPLNGKVGNAAILRNIDIARKRLKLTDEIPITRVVDFSPLNEVLKEKKQ